MSRHSDSGYNGYSMSNRAVQAYEDGLVPASKIREVPTPLIQEFCRYAEWHHTSSQYNCVAKREYFQKEVNNKRFFFYFRKKERRAIN